MPEPLQVWRCVYCSRVYEIRDECVEHMKKGHVKCPYCGQFATSDGKAGGIRCRQCGATQVTEKGVTGWHPG